MLQLWKCNTGPCHVYFYSSSDTWFLATCADCEPLLPQPFRVEAERDKWAQEHGMSTGHRVAVRSNTQSVRCPACNRVGVPLSKILQANVINIFNYVRGGSPDEAEPLFSD